MRWLSDDEQRAWRSYLEGTNRLYALLGDDMKRRAGFGQEDFEILVRLSEAPEDRMRMSDLAENTSFSRSRLSHAVARLEADGLVTRETCDTDRRGTFAVLTPHGRTVIESLAPHHVTLVREHLFDHLSAADVKALQRIFDKVRKSVP
ncbi:MAG TPA: MarR family transcriptional regulator [Acidimicrobiales bacterium]|nr:MarR family transcriptional regulator [Acidimicrobiales bacterium]